MRLQFTDILGVNKNVEIPASQFEKALAGDIMFDGSSIEGFVRIEESDMLLAPDLSTFQVFPWGARAPRGGGPAGGGGLGGGGAPPRGGPGPPKFPLTPDATAAPPQKPRA